MKTAIAAIAAIAAFALALPAAAAAEDRTQERSIVVKYNDLDLSTKKDRVELERRIDLAARVACSYVEQRTGTRLADTEGRDCYRSAKASATKAFASVIERQRMGG